MKVAELKEELRKRGLSTKGLKAELEERLKQANESANSVDQLPEEDGGDDENGNDENENSYDDAHDETDNIVEVEKETSDEQETHVSGPITTHSAMDNEEPSSIGETEVVIESQANIGGDENAAFESGENASSPEMEHIDDSEMQEEEEEHATRSETRELDDGATPNEVGLADVQPVDDNDDHDDTVREHIDDRDQEMDVRDIERDEGEEVHPNANIDKDHPGTGLKAAEERETGRNGYRGRDRSLSRSRSDRRPKESKSGRSRTRSRSRSRGRRSLRKGDLEDTKLYLGNLSYRTDEKELEYAFEKFGRIKDVFIPRERDTFRSRGFGFVTFDDPRDAEDALHEMDGKDIDGRRVRIEVARSRPPRDSSPRQSRRRYSRSRSGSRSRRY